MPLGRREFMKLCGAAVASPLLLPAPEPFWVWTDCYGGKKFFSTEEEMDKWMEDETVRNERFEQQYRTMMSQFCESSDPLVLQDINQGE